ADERGARAAERAFAFLERFPIQPVVLILPEGLDPADFVTRHGGEALRGLAKGAVPLVEYMVPRTVGREDPARGGGQTCDGGLDRPRPTERVRAPAGRARGGLRGLGGPGDRAAPPGSPRRGPRGGQARLGAGAGRARDAATARPRRRRLPAPRAASYCR